MSAKEIKLVDALYTSNQPRFTIQTIVNLRWRTLNASDGDRQGKDNV